MSKYTIVSALIKYKDRYLIAKRSKNKKFAPDKWELISGFVDKPLSQEKIMLEELEEELKLSGKITKKGQPYQFNDSDGIWTVIPFAIDAINDKSILNKEEHSEIRWVTRKELENYPDIKEDIKNFKSQGML